MNKLNNTSLALSPTLCKNCSKHCQAIADTDTTYCCYGISETRSSILVHTISEMSHTSNVFVCVYPK